MTYKEPFAKSVRGDEFGNLAEYRHGKPHRGQDWAPGENKVIPAIADGVIVDVFLSEVLGWVVEQLTTDSMHVQYCHLAQRPKSLKKGQAIKLGAPIGRVGNTGTATTGAHLHLAMSKVPHPHLCDYSKLVDPLKHIEANKS